jgi:hypothetical protein
MYMNANVATRDFSHGKALVNPSSSQTYTVTLSGGYLDLYGNAVTSVTLTPASGIVLLANTPPTVSISSPAPGASFTAPATINITANAADVDGGTISKVEFYNNGILLGTDTSSSGGWTYSWANVAASGSGGIHLTAKAYDNNNASTTSGQVNCTVTDSALKLYWKLDETSGITAADSSGSGYDAGLYVTYNRPTFLACKINNGLSFNGTNQYIARTSGTISIPKPQDTQTETFWFYLSSNPTATKTALTITQYGSYQSQGTTIGFINSNGMKIGVWRNSNSALLVYTSVLPAAGAWHHVAYVKDGNNKYLYIDGTLFSSGTNATDSAASISVIVAAATNQQVASWPGKLDEIRSYNRALSGTEISALWLGKQ